MKEKTIELTNGAFLIMKLNVAVAFEEYEDLIKRAKKAVRDGALIVPSSMDVIVIDKEGKAVKV